MSEEQKISQRYRELSREEPPRALDDAILAASRRAVESRPAPLVVPAGPRRWYFPLAAAAVVMLAVAVTVHVERQHEKLELAEAPVAVSPTAREEQAAAAQAPAEAPRAFTPEPKPVPAPAQAPSAAADSRELRAQRDAEPLADLQKAQKAPASPAPAAPPEASSRQDAVSGMRESPQAKPAAPMREEARARASRAPDSAPAVAGALGASAYASPEQWLQGIDDLKRQGRHDEAEKQLAEFRKRYPDYRIPEAILEKFERR
jgi:hypothetical protein